MEPARPTPPSTLGMVETTIPKKRLTQVESDTDSDHIDKEFVSGPITYKQLVEILKDRAPTLHLDSSSIELMEKLSRYNLQTAMRICQCLVNGSLRDEDLLSPYLHGKVEFADGDSDSESICDESGGAKAPFFHRHHPPPILLHQTRQARCSR